ncbi:MAG TPA: mechanosensitive ion channel family protein [Rubrivivax sp.]|nr:mechanosensitive ion channel family protein [Rubrivivax sp.]HPO19694.1 mechanosensitive ion channel family protein [Rubrivivax sp.]
MVRSASLRPWLHLGLLALWACLLAAAPHAAAQAAAPAAASAAAPGLTTLADLATQHGPASAQPPGRIVVMNRGVATLRASLFGIAAQARAAEAEARIRAALRHGGEMKVDLTEVAEGVLVRIDGALMFAITPQDSDEGTLAGAQASAGAAAQALQQAIDESRESRNLRSLLSAALVTLGAGVLMLLLLWLLRRLRGRLQAWLTRKTLAHADRLRVGGVDLVRREGLLRFEQGFLNLLFWALALLLVYEWLSVSLAQFPFTRPWGEQLNQFLFNLLARFALGIVRAVPDLIAAALIFWLAWLLTRMLRGFFAKVASGRVQLHWLDADVAVTTSRLCVAAVWLFALAMAYPYLPGSETEAFKGLSVLLGLMISLGASNLVGQLASGLILTYTRTFHVGEYVRVGSDEGTVMGLGTFTTRIRTGMGEELTISNTQILGAVTRNYSRTVKGRGFIVDTTVTIGYDTPWRQVNAMLVEAARRTPGVLADPPPHVFQVTLSDFYPEYRLVCQAVPSEPRPRAEVMSLLHANVQDVFNEHGVQIMSPHYLGDPASAKVVPREHWYDAPAQPPDGTGLSRERPR